MEYDSLFVDESLPKMLTRDEVITLYKQMEQGNMEARKKLISCNIKLVIKRVMSNFMSVDYDKKELVSVGCVGLIKAVDTYDISRGYEFSTYIGKCIDNEIKMFLRKLNKYSGILSLDDTLFVMDNDDDMKLKDCIKSRDIDMEEEYIEKDLSIIELQLLQQSMECLNERDRKIVMLYFGFYNNKRYEQQEIADMFEISQSQTSKIINCSLRKIKARMEWLGNLDKKVSDNILKRSKNK